MSQVFAVIADATRERLDRCARQHGIQKSHLIETAILHHLPALEEMPADVVVPLHVGAVVDALPEAMRIDAGPRALRPLAACRVAKADGQCQ